MTAKLRSCRNISPRFGLSSSIGYFLVDAAFFVDFEALELLRVLFFRVLVDFDELLFWVLVVFFFLLTSVLVALLDVDVSLAMAGAAV